MWLSDGQTGRTGGGEKYREQKNQNGLGCRCRDNLPLFRKQAGLSPFHRSSESPETQGFLQESLFTGKAVNRAKSGPNGQSLCVSSGQTGKVGPISKFAFLSDKDLCQDISLIPNQKALLGESFERRSDFSDFRAALKFCLFLREDRQPSLENLSA